MPQQPIQQVISLRDEPYTRSRYLVHEECESNVLNDIICRKQMFKRESVRGPPSAAREKVVLDFLISTESSNQIIVKSKILLTVIQK